MTQFTPPALSTDWRGWSDHQRILIEDAELYVRCGLHDWERDPDQPNRIKVTVELWTTARFDPAQPGRFIDYDRVRKYLLTWPEREHTDLLETLVAELVEFSFEDPLVEACRVRIVKPDIFPEAAAAGVEWFRHRPRAE